MKPIEVIRAKEWFASIASMIILTNIAIVLNIPFLRQILGFLVITILPGLLMLQIIKLNRIGLIERFVLSVGLSISFLMFFGLGLNNSSLILGYETPLAITPLLIAFNLAFIVLIIIGYYMHKDSLFTIPNLKLNASEKAFLIIPILFPALSVFGIHIMNTTDNNLFLMFLLLLISIYVVFVSISDQKFPKRIYPAVIFLISISLVLLLSLRSNHLIGIDTHTEYYLFQTTLDRLHWKAPTIGNALDACLAISLLPTIYQSILNISPEFLFRILYSLIYSISPLVIYVLSKKYIRESYAFLASCFFMFQYCFLFTEANARTNIAILFFALMMMVLFNDKIDLLKKRILFIVFMASCIISHYSTTYIVFFIMSGTFFGLEIFQKKSTSKKLISLTIVLLFAAMIFFWYSQITETAFNSGVGFIRGIFNALHEFFIEESRGLDLRQLQGGWLQKSAPYKIEFVFMWLTFVSISVGVVTLLRRRREMTSQYLKFRKPYFLKDAFEVGYSVTALACSGVLVAAYLLPYVSRGYGIDRLYAVAITILSVFFVVGGIIISKQIFKERRSEDGSQVRTFLTILLILIPYFLCVTGVIYNISGIPRAIILNSEGEHYDIMYIHDQESCGAKWLRNNVDEKVKVDTDYYGRFGLVSQAGFPPESIRWYRLVCHEKIDGHIYLRYQNVVNNELVGRNKSSHIFTYYDLAEYDDIFMAKDNIYSNGGSEVWK